MCVNGLLAYKNKSCEFYVAPMQVMCLLFGYWSIKVWFTLRLIYDFTKEIHHIRQFVMVIRESIHKMNIDDLIASLLHIDNRNPPTARLDYKLATCV